MSRANSRRTAKASSAPKSAARPGSGAPRKPWPFGSVRATLKGQGFVVCALPPFALLSTLFCFPLSHFFLGCSHPCFWMKQSFHLSCVTMDSVSFHQSCFSDCSKPCYEVRQVPRVSWCVTVLKTGVSSKTMSR